jgi:hypothetical protein
MVMLRAGSDTYLEEKQGQEVYFGIKIKTLLLTRKNMATRAMGGRVRVWEEKRCPLRSHTFQAVPKPAQQQNQSFTRSSSEPRFFNSMFVSSLIIGFAFLFFLFLFYQYVNLKPGHSGQR